MNELLPIEPGCMALVLAGPDAGKVTGVIACEGVMVGVVKDGEILEIYTDNGEHLWEITDLFGWLENSESRIPYVEGRHLMRIDGISEEDAEMEALQMYLDSQPYPTMFSYIHRITKGADDEGNNSLADIYRQHQRDNG